MPTWAGGGFSRHNKDAHCILNGYSGEGPSSWHQGGSDQQNPLDEKWLLPWGRANARSQRVDIQSPPFTSFPSPNTATLSALLPVNFMGLGAWEQGQAPGPLGPSGDLLWGRVGVERKGKQGEK